MSEPDTGMGGRLIFIAGQAVCLVDQINSRSYVSLKMAKGKGP